MPPATAHIWQAAAYRSPPAIHPIRGDESDHPPRASGYCNLHFPARWRKQKECNRDRFRAGRQSWSWRRGYPWCRQLPDWNWYAYRSPPPRMSMDEPVWSQHDLASHAHVFRGWSSVRDIIPGRVDPRLAFRAHAIRDEQRFSCRGINGGNGRHAAGKKPKPRR